MSLTGPAVWTAFDHRFVWSPVDGRVVSLNGDLDRAVADDLAGALADAIALHDADLVVDLRDVTFMDASTVGVLVGIQEVLDRYGRNLRLRLPSRPARHVLEVCGLAGLVEASSGGALPPTSKAS